MPPEIPRAVLALLLATLLAVRGRKRKSLSLSGAIAGFIVGFLSVLSSIRFGITLLTFYLSGTRVTRYNSQFKRKYEDGYTEAAGNRGAFQVFASSLPAVVIAVIYLAIFRYDAPLLPTFYLRSTLLLAYMLFFAACAGDTFASEIGFAMPGPSSRPILITAPWRLVPRGTNGGITWQGTAASALGGFIVGFVFFLVGPELSMSQLWLIPVGVYGGLMGSIIDSIFGALFQASYLDRSTGKIVAHNPSVINTEQYQHITGFDLVSGETVNAASAIVTAATAPILLTLFGT